MKRTVTLLISVLLVLSALGCAANKHADIRKNLQEAKDAILIAKALDAPSGESTMLAEAERYYKIAEENFSRTPRGRLSGFLLQSKTLNAKASQNALLAKKRPGLPLRNSKTKISACVLKSSLFKMIYRGSNQAPTLQPVKNWPKPIKMKKHIA